MTYDHEQVMRAAVKGVCEILEVRRPVIVDGDQQQEAELVVKCSNVVLRQPDDLATNRPGQVPGQVQQILEPYGAELDDAFAELLSCIETCDIVTEVCVA